MVKFGWFLFVFKWFFKVFEGFGGWSLGGGFSIKVFSAQPSQREGMRIIKYQQRSKAAFPPPRQQLSVCQFVSISSCLFVSLSVCQFLQGGLWYGGDKVMLVDYVTSYACYFVVWGGSGPGSTYRGHGKFVVPPAPYQWKL